MSQRLKEGLFGLVTILSIPVLICFLVYDFNNKNNEKELAKLNPGITHQYLDTNLDGKYDMYRFVQRRLESTCIDANGDGNFESCSDTDLSRTFTTSLEEELTKEECLREYRPGRINFNEWR